MPEKITWSISAQVASGPRMKESQTMEVEAYDKFRVTIENDETEKEIEVIPGNSNNACFLIISSDKYNDTTDAGVNLNFKVNDTGNPSINLDAPIFLIGKGATGMLESGNAPQKFFFSNSLGEAVNIEILVGRDSTP
jgi:hypothetical protein